MSHEKMAFVVMLAICATSGAIEVHQVAPMEVKRSSPVEVKQVAPMEAKQAAPMTIREAAPFGVRNSSSQSPEQPAAAVGPSRAAGSSKGATAAVGMPNNGNPLEPISNGLSLTMTRDEVKRRFGEPGRRAGFPSCVMHFPDFTVETCGSDRRISRAYLSGPNARLSSGIGIGSSQGDVGRVFGDPRGGRFGAHKVAVSYDGDRVASIKIDYEKKADERQGGAQRPANYNACAPNCGYDYSTGQSAPTIYNPNYNYSPNGN